MASSHFIQKSFCGFNIELHNLPVLVLVFLSYLQVKIVSPTPQMLYCNWQFRKICYVLWLGAPHHSALGACLSESGFTCAYAVICTVSISDLLCVFLCLLENLLIVNFLMSMRGALRHYSNLIKLKSTSLWVMVLLLKC